MKKLFISILLTAFATLIGYAGPNPVLQNAYTTNNATVADAYVRTISRSITNGLATTNYVNVATNGLATTNYVNVATNDLASTSYVNTATNGLASTSYVNTATNGLASTSYVIAATNTLIITSNQIANNTISSNKLDAVAYEAFIAGSGSGISVTAGTNILMVTNGPGTLVTVHGTANVTQAGLAAGSYTLAGNGSGLTNIHGSNSIAAGTISTNRMDPTAYAAFIGNPYALTNGDTRDITLYGTLSASLPIYGAVTGDASANPSFSVPNGGSLAFPDGEVGWMIKNDGANGLLFINGNSGNLILFAENGIITGNGAGLTNIHGSNSIAAGTISTNRMDPTAYAAFIGGTNFSGIIVTNDAAISNDVSIAHNLTIGNSLAQGFNAIASGPYSSAQGSSTTASGSYSHAEGSSTTASGQSSHAEGDSTIASGNYSHAEGKNTTASGESSHAEGAFTTASGTYSHAAGFRAYATNNQTWVWSGDSTAFGSTAANQFSVNALGGIRLLGSPIYGDGSGLTNIHGSNSIAAGTISTNRMDPTAYAAFIGGSSSSGTNFSGIIVTNNAIVGNKLTISNTLAQGYNATASGEYSSAQGHSVTASGDYGSHAEGWQTAANNNAAHAEGLGTTAGGGYSHAEGVMTIASGEASHAEGSYTTAAGDYSHAAGIYAKVREEDDYSWIWNANEVSYNSAAPFTSTAANQFSVNARGGIRLLGSPIYGDGSGLSNIMTGSLGLGTAAYSNSTAFRLIDNINFSGIIVTNNLSVTNDVWIGNNVNIGNNATIGNSLIQGLYNTVNGSFSHAQGFNITVDGDYSHAEGYGTTATANFTHAEGYLTAATAGGAHAEGEYSLASGTGSHAEGESTEAAGAYSHAEGYSTQAGGDHSHAEGYLSIASGQASHVQGYATRASGFASHASGVNAYATNDYTWVWSGSSTAFGSTADNQFAVNAPGGIRLLGSPIYGDGSGLSNITIVSLGLGTAAYSNSEAFRLITNTNFSGIIVTNNAIVGNKLTISNTLAQGLNPIASGQYSSAQGKSVTATGNYSHAQGESTTASGQSSHAEGYSTRAIGDKSHAEGNLTLAYEIGSHAEGESSKAVGLYSHAEGYDTAATNQAAHAEGYQTIATNQAAHAEGRQTTAGGDASHAEGYGTLASGLRSHAEGDSTAATNEASHAQGYATQAWGKYSHAEGASTTASNYASHAEGDSTAATGTASHAEGWLGQATGDHSHAEGYFTQATGENSHAEGYMSQANGYASHAEGSDTRANGLYSHSEGYYTFAEGEYSHAAGIYAKAEHDRSWVWAGDLSSYTALIPFTSTAASQFSVWATGGIRLLGSPIYGDGSGLTNLPPASASYTNNTGLPGVVVGYGIGTNLSTLATVTQLSSATNAATITASINATNAVVANLSSGLYTVSGNGAGLTNLNFSAGNYATNASALTNVIDMTKPYSAATISNTLTLTALSGVSTFATNVQWATRFYTNTGTAGAVNFPASWIGNTVGQYITNQSVISVVVYPGFGTNVIYRNLK